LQAAGIPTSTLPEVVAAKGRVRTS
jgi:hypothetical protein